MPELHRFPAAIVAGFLWALAFPLPGWAACAWLAPGCLLFAAAGLRPWEMFRVGYCGGLAFCLVSLRWLLHIPFPAGAVAGWLALAAYCALYPALWTTLAWSCLSTISPNFNSLDAPPPHSTPRPIAAWTATLARYARLSVWPRLFWPALCAMFWVALEMIQARLLSGFAWNFLGASQWQNVPLIQFASLTGVYGVSFLVCWCSVALAGALTTLLSRHPGSSRWAWMADVRVPLLVVVAAISAGFPKLARALSNRPVEGLRPISLTLIQPSIPQELIWNEAEAPARFEQIRKLSETALALSPDAMVWPEGPLSTLTREQVDTMIDLVKRREVWWIFGSDDSEERDGKRHSYNSAFLFTPEGRYQNTYRKRKLVMFGEFVPLERWLPFLRYLTPIGGGFTPGDRPSTFDIGGRARCSPLICFEDIFPHHVREYVAPEIDFLIELTNDGWFGESSAQWQHAANVAFRAVENGIPVVRCTNNGLTCWFDEFGRLRDFLGRASGSVYQPGFLHIDLPIAGRRAATSTFYQRHGDVFGWTLTLGTAFASLRIWTATRRRASPLALRPSNSDK